MQKGFYICAYTYMNTSKVVTRSTSNVSCRKDSIALGPVSHTQREGRRGREGESERERAFVCVWERKRERDRMRERACERKGEEKKESKGEIERESKRE